MDKKAAPLRGKNRPPPQEACNALSAVVAAESRMLKFVEGNIARCGIPPQVPKQIKESHARTTELRTRVCSMAQQQQRGPAPPSLGEALGTTRVPDASNVKKGAGTFDTLTGSPLGR